MDKPIIVCVIWNDAHGDTVSFDTTEVMHEPYQFTSIGFLVKSNEIGVSLARERGQDGKWRDHEFIPRAMVVDEWVIGVLKKPRARRQSPAPEVHT